MNPCPKFGLGTLHFGSLLNKEESRSVILKALEKGVNFFDTAPLYGNGEAEKILGDVLFEVPNEAFICTKVGLHIALRKDQRFGVEVAKLSATTIKQSVEESLRRLKRESIDLLMLHAFDAKTPLEETLQVLSSLHQEGKVRAFGCSNYNPSQLQLLLKSLPQNFPLLAAQCHYNMIERRASRFFIPLCQEKEMWVVVNRALARGALSAKYRMGQELPKESRAAKSARIQKWLTPEKLSLIDTLSSIAKSYGTSLMSVSLQWLLKSHSRMVILLGARNGMQLEQWLEAANALIDPKAFEAVENIIMQGENVYQYPSRYFEK